jgi:hypothetical protein
MRTGATVSLIDAIGTGIEQPVIRSEIVKFVYAGMILQLPLNKVKEFFIQNAPPGFSSSDESDIFKVLWTEGRWVALDYLISLFHQLEILLAEHGISTEDFIQTTLQKTCGGLLLPASTVLYWGKPFLKLFFLTADIRLLMLKIVNHFTSRISPNIVQRIIKHEPDEEWNSTILLFMISKMSKPYRLPVRLFAGPFPKFDCELWTAKIVQTIPSSLRLPNFEERFMVADCRNPGDILAQHRISSSDGVVHIDGIPYGFQSTFNEFCKKNDLKVERYCIPDKKIIVMVNDYFCDQKKRIILHKGCAYGTPVYMFGFRYRKNVEVPKDLLSPLLDNAVGPLKVSWDHVATFHEQMLANSSKKAVVVFHRKDESISINGLHFVKNVPAKILKKIVKAYCSKGQTVFSHREFAADKSIFEDPKHPNLVVRLQRLSQALNNQFPSITLKKTSRGRFSLITGCRMEYHER